MHAKSATLSGRLVLRYTQSSGLRPVLSPFGPHLQVVSMKPTPASEPLSVPAPLSYEVDGVRVSFDPASSRWLAAGNGKKTHSQSFDTLMERVKGWDGSGASSAPAAAAREQEVEDVLLHFTREDSWWLSPDSVSPLRVRMRWNANGAPTVVRFQRAPESRSRTAPGWESSQASSLRLGHPEVLTAEDRAWWARLVLARAQVLLLQKTQQDIARQWEAAKTHRTVAWEQQRVGSGDERAWTSKPMDTRALASKSSHTHYGQTMLPADVPFLDSSMLGDTTGWTARPDGSWQQDGVTLRLMAGRYSSPEFVVEREDNGTVCRLGRWSDWRDAFYLANATVRLDRDQVPVRSMRVLTDKNHWIKDPASNWPLLQEVRAGVVIPETRSGRTHQTQAFLLTRSNLDKNDKHVRTRVSDEAVSPYPVWESLSGCSYNVPVWYDAEPVDEATLALIMRLKTRETELVTAARQDEAERLLAQTQAALTWAYNRAGDAEDPVRPDGEALVARWKREMERWTMQAEAAPGLAEIREFCEQARAEADGLRSVSRPSRRAAP